MKMGKIEKWFMNTEHHAEHVIRRAEKLLQYVNVKEKGNLLEVGCGNGAVSKYVAKTYRLNVTGIDVDPEQIRHAQENINNTPNVRFLEADSIDLPFQDNDFDIVLSFGVMHHISNWTDALQEINRVLKPKGYFVYWDIVYSKWLAKIGKLFSHKYGMTTMHALNVFIEKTHFFTIHSKLSRFHHFEAVYRKNEA